MADTTVTELLIVAFLLFRSIVRPGFNFSSVSTIALAAGLSFEQAAWSTVHPRSSTRASFLSRLWAKAIGMEHEFLGCS